MNRRPYGYRPTVAGFSLLELLIGTAIGVFVSAGIIQVYIANKSTYRVAEGTARLQENSRFALTFLQQNIQLAGLPKALGIAPLDTDPGASDDGASADSSDSITVQFRGDQDCLGNPFDQTNPAEIIRNRFYLGPGEDGSGSSLYCDSLGDDLAPQSIVDGVDQLQVLYGIDKDNSTVPVIDGYVTITQLRDLLTANADFNIVSVRLALLINTVEPVLPQPETRSYELLDNPAVAFDDRLGRQVVTTTILLRNRALP